MRQVRERSQKEPDLRCRYVEGDFGEAGASPADIPTTRKASMSKGITERLAAKEDCLKLWATRPGNPGAKTGTTMPTRA